MNVALVNESDREGSQSNSPRVPAGKGNATVDILKNDDANGVLSFSGPKVGVASKYVFSYPFQLNSMF